MTFTLLLILATQFLSPPPLPREFRGVWVATVDNIDWPSSRNLPVARQQRELSEVFERASRLGLNVVILQVRPMADALYPSDLEPWSEFLTGRQGRPPRPHWDPLAYALREAHRRGIELHAWINPFRAWHPAAKGEAHPTHVTRALPESVRTYGDLRWLDPADARAREHVLAVVRDLLRRYDLDGLHIDDYFYPYPRSGLAFPDDGPWEAYRRGGGTLERSDWRRDHVNGLVRDLYGLVRGVRPEAKFGISPFGIARPGVPPGIRAGVDQYAQLYADVRLWMREGWYDYLVPQLYWPIEPPSQSFRALLDWWMAESRPDRPLVAGLFTSRLAGRSGSWPAGEIVAQIELARQRGAAGTAHFSDRALRTDAGGIRAHLQRLNAQKALPPPSPRADGPPPAPPTLQTVRRAGGWRLEWTHPERERVRFWAVQTFRDGGWELAAILPADMPRWSGPAERVAVRAVDRYGRESEAVLFSDRD